MVIRQVASILVLPFAVTVLVPLWIAPRATTSPVAPGDLISVGLVSTGIGLAAAGLTLFCWSLYHFWTRGRGTLAPWDPPKELVVTGPYRHVRNPMISGVILILAAEAFVWRSVVLANWAGLFVLINAVYIPALEEPMLGARFGEPYSRYVRSVPRFIPRLTPYHG